MPFVFNVVLWLWFDLLMHVRFSIHGFLGFFFFSENLLVLLLLNWMWCVLGFDFIDFCSSGRGSVAVGVWVNSWHQWHWMYVKKVGSMGWVSGVFVFLSLFLCFESEVGKPGGSGHSWASNESDGIECHKIRDLVIGRQFCFSIVHWIASMGACSVCIFRFLWRKLVGIFFYNGSGLERYCYVEC